MVHAICRLANIVLQAIVLHELRPSFHAIELHREPQSSSLAAEAAYDLVLVNMPGVAHEIIPFPHANAISPTRVPVKIAQSGADWSNGRVPKIIVLEMASMPRGPNLQVHSIPVLI